MEKGKKNIFIHLGGDIVVNYKDIVAIFDIETTSLSKYTRNFLAKAQKDSLVVNVSAEMPKSFIVVKKGDKTKVYVSPISSVTLYKRANNGSKAFKGGKYIYA